MAAACLTLAINMSTNPIVECLGAQPLSSSKLENLVQNYRVVCVEMDDASERQNAVKDRI